MGTFVLCFTTMKSNAPLQLQHAQGLSVFWGPDQGLVSPQGSGAWTLSLLPALHPTCSWCLSHPTEDTSRQVAFRRHVRWAQCFTPIDALLLVEFPVAVADPWWRYSELRGGFWGFQKPPPQKAALAWSLLQGKEEAEDRG